VSSALGQRPGASTASNPSARDLGHEVGAHLLVLHPGEDGRIGPVPAEADLDEVAAGHGRRLSMRRRHRGCRDRRECHAYPAPLSACAFEVHDAHGAVTVGRRPPRVAAGQVMAVVPAPRTMGDRAPAFQASRPTNAPDVGVAAVRVPDQHLGVAVVEDRQVIERVHAHIEVRPRAPGQVSRTRGSARGPRWVPVRPLAVPSQGAPPDGHVRLTPPAGPPGVRQSGTFANVWMPLHAMSPARLTVKKGPRAGAAGRCLSCQASILGSATAWQDVHDRV